MANDTALRHNGGGRSDASPKARRIPLRPYQTAAIEAVQAAAARGVQRPLVVLPTGAGKTITFADMIDQRGGRALVLAHRDELISQAADKIGQVAPGLAIGIVRASDNDVNAQVVVGSVQTLCLPHRLEQLTADFTTVVVDEAHHAPARIYRDVLNGVGSFTDGGPLTVGFTATAGRSDGIGLGHVWQDIVHQRGILQMIAEGYLVDVRALSVTSDVDLDKVKVRGGDYSDGDLGAAIEDSEAIPAAALAYAKYAGDRRGVAFTPTVATSQALAAELNSRGIVAEHLDGSIPRAQRRAILARLHTGETQVVTNCMVLTEGFDEPAVSCVLMLRPTKSTGLFTQMVGRALRPHPPSGKTDALVLDLAGASAAGLATLADLAGLPPGSVDDGKSLTEAVEEIEEENAAVERRRAVVRQMKAEFVDLFRRSNLRWLQLGDAHVLPAGKDITVYLVPTGDPADDRWQVYEHRRGRQPSRTYDGLNGSLAFGVGEEVARSGGGVLSRSDARWRDQPPSDAQLRALRNARADISQVRTKGEASDLMALTFAAPTVRRLLAGAR
ncbi:DEAD/DEAH box helicase [Actinomadura sp. WMMA1423]|uniref:DEAD/DEAH box helicase n=1 Tax=Actinomadura sp. WMMA1423 TaxID=2591108 RepID=UPI0011469997|nr:DEAD/DEAH box helicase [Actinomadura sp. WMMA1423]